MSRNRFVTNKTVKITISDGDWIEVKEALSWDEFEPIQNDFKSKGARGIISLLNLVLKAWSFKDEEGNIAQITPEAISKIELLTLEEMSAPLMSLYLPEKKSSIPSAE